MSHEVESMFSVREKPWHYEMTKEVTKIIQEAPNSFEALVAAGLDWTVEAKKISILGENEAIPNAVANVRSSDNKVLGILTDRYKIVQNTDAFAFTDTLIGGDVRYETAGSLFGGRKIWLLAKLPTEQILDDEVEPYLCFTNSHDGSGSVRAIVTPIRVVCNNTLNFALNNAKRAWSVRHTGNINAKIQEAQEALNLTKTYMGRLNEYAEQMVDIKVDEGALRKMLGKCFKAKEEQSAREQANQDKLMDGFMTCYFAPDIAQYLGTAWGALNAMADLVDHGEPNRASANYAENNWARIMGGHAMVDQFAGMLAGIGA